MFPLPSQRCNVLLSGHMLHFFQLFFVVAYLIACLIKCSIAFLVIHSVPCCQAVCLVILCIVPVMLCKCNYIVCSFRFPSKSSYCWKVQSRSPFSTLIFCLVLSAICFIASLFAESTHASLPAKVCLRQVPKSL